LIFEQKEKKGNKVDIVCALVKNKKSQKFFEITGKTKKKLEF